MLVMGDGTGNVQTKAIPRAVTAMRASAAHASRRIGWAQLYGAGALLAACTGQLTLVCTHSMAAGFAGALIGALMGGLAMRWVDVNRVSVSPQVSRDAAMQALEDAQRTQHEVLARLRQISQATQDAAHAART